MVIEIKKTHNASKTFRKQVGFQTSVECFRGICFLYCVWVFQSLGAELEKALEPNCFGGCFSLSST